MIFLFINLFPIYISQFILNIQNIFGTGIINFINEIYGDFDLNFVIYSQNIPKYVFGKNIFDIVLDSSNSSELNQQIIFQCGLFGPT